MAVRIKEGMIPYKGGDGIEITNNHIINVLLREANNLIHINENRELYVDLQLDDGITPDDDFPVGVTTGKILQEDGRQQSGLILNWKTTSGDYARLIYANDGNLYVDLGDGVWILLGGGGADFGNVKKFELNSLNDSTGQDILDWIRAGKLPIIRYNGESYMMEQERNTGCIIFCSTFSGIAHWMAVGDSAVQEGRLTLWCDNDPNVFENFTYEQKIVSPNVLDTTINYNTPYTPQYPGSPATKKYVDDGLALKQDVLTPGTRITIQVDPVTGDTVISADVSGVMTYKGNVTDPTALPSSGNTQGDCRYSESDGHLYAWDGTQWKDIGGTGINLNDYFNMTINNSDDITEGNTNLFVTQIEKNTWNAKQDALNAGNGIDITNNVISAKYTGGSNISIDNNFAINNDAPFEPDNQGSLGQLLQKTSNGYEWRTLNYVSSVNGQSGPVTVDEFDPENAGTTGQVLQKTATGYEWANNTASQYISGHGTNVNQTTREITNTLPFEPTNTGSAGQVIKLNQDGVTYSWQNDESGGGGGGGGTTYYGGDYINITSSHYINNTAPFIPAGGTGTTGQVLTKTSNGYTWDDLDLPSGENNVKFWKINSQGMTTAALRPIFEWVNADVNNGAILNDSYTKDAFIFHKMETRDGHPTAVFLGKKRNSEAYLSVKGYITTQWEWELTITYANNGYSINCDKSQDDATKTNYISALPVGYDPDPSDPHPFMPTEDYEPATKKYVDTVAGGGGGGSYVAGRGINISNNEISTTGVLPVTTGTTSSCTGIWVGSASEYANIQNPSATTLYIVFPT